MGIMPFNPVTGTRYKGINLVNLMAQEYGDPRWMTYKQAKEKGYQVRRGERAAGRRLRGAPKQPLSNFRDSAVMIS